MATTNETKIEPKEQEKTYDSFDNYNSFLKNKFSEKNTKERQKINNHLFSEELKEIETIENGIKTTKYETKIHDETKIVNESYKIVKAETTEDKIRKLQMEL